MDVARTILSINHRKGRRNPVAGICIHVTEGSAASVVSWFNNPASQVSSHYMVTRAGQIVQFVSEADEAWAQGRVDKPTARIVLAKGATNPNSYLISIEHEGTGTTDLTVPQRVSSVELIRDIATRHGLPINRDTVIGHREVFSKKTCPGVIDVDRLVREATGVAVPAPAPSYPRVVYSPAVGDWLVVTRYASDTDWSYVPLGTVSGGTRASTPLSLMPRNP